MLRYRIIHPIARALCSLAMTIDSPWLFELSGSLEHYADVCAYHPPRRDFTPTVTPSHQ